MEQTWSRKRGGQDKNRHINVSALVMLCNPEAIGIKWDQRSLGVSERERETEEND